MKFEEIAGPIFYCAILIVLLKKIVLSISATAANNERVLSNRMGLQAPKSLNPSLIIIKAQHRMKGDTQHNSLCK